LKLGKIIFPQETLKAPTLNKGIVNPFYNHAFNDIFFVTSMNCDLNVYSDKLNPSLGDTISKHLQKWLRHQKKPNHFPWPFLKNVFTIIN